MYFSHTPIHILTTPTTFPPQSANHRIELRVTFHGDTPHPRTHSFPQNAVENAPADFDISSAFRSELALYTPHPQSSYATSPVLTATVTARLLYLDLDTVTEGSLPLQVSEEEVQARRGSVSESDLYFGNIVTGDAEHVSLTTKPTTSPELVPPNALLQLGIDTLRIPSTAPHGELIPRSRLHPDLQGYFQVDRSPHRHLFYFLNTRGEIETISFTSFDTLTAQIKRDQQSLSPSPSGLQNLKSYLTSHRQSLKLSTGYLSEDWLQWTASDFFQSEHIWLQTSQGLLPVVIQVDENLTIHNHSNGDISALSFTVTSSLTGPLTP